MRLVFEGAEGRMKMLKFTIELPDRITYSNRDHGKLSQLDLSKLGNEIVAEAAAFGLKTTIMNAYNSGDGSHAEKIAAMDKRIAALARGEWRSSERGPAIYTVWKDEVFIPHCIESGMTLADANKLVRDKVNEHFPKGTNATFANYIEATAIEAAAEFDGDRQAALEAVEAWYDDQLASRRKAREKAEAKITAPKLDLSAFKKAAK